MYIMFYIKIIIILLTTRPRQTQGHDT